MVTFVLPVALIPAPTALLLWLMVYPLQSRTILSAPRARQVPAPVIFCVRLMSCVKMSPQAVVFSALMYVVKLDTLNT